MESPPGLSVTAWRAVLAAALAAACAWLAFGHAELGDYPIDAGPALNALAAGHLGAFLDAHPDMGPVTILMRAPVVALAGGGALARYEWGALVCLLAVVPFALYLASLAGRRGAGWPAQAAIAGLCLVNPLNVYAIETGHPEEILTAALAVTAVAVASQGQRGRATLLLGLAIASKQWAVIAVFPVLMALPAGRLRAAAGAVGIAAALTVPFLIANPDGFFTTHRSLAFESQDVTHWSVWYPFADLSRVYDPQLHASATAHVASPLVARLSHPLILLAAVLVPLGLALRRRRMHLSGGDAMALLALLGLLRCVLDPVDNLYYHSLFLLALIGWEALETRGLPLRALAAVAALELLSRWLQTSDVTLFNVLYIWLAIFAAAAIAGVLFRPRAPRSRRERGVLGASPLAARAPLARP